MVEKVTEFPGRATLEQQAADWVIRLDRKEPLSRKDRGELRAWLGQSTAHREQLHRLAELWDKLDVLTELAVSLDAAAPAAVRRRLGWSSLSRLAAAAAIVAVVSIGFLALRQNTSVDDMNGLYATAIGQQRSIMLEDGSTVLLNTDSQIQVRYGDEFRDIALLRGEARFTVANDPDVPFRVAARNGRVRAVGTAFSVHVREATVDVTVTEGHVALEAIASAEPAARIAGRVVGDDESPEAARLLGTLSAGQIATLTTDSSGQAELAGSLLSVTPAELAKRESWTEGVLLFSGEPLEAVVREIGRYTATTIEVADPEVGAIRIGGRFPVGETDTMLETLESTFGLRVTRLSANNVVITAGE